MLNRVSEPYVSPMRSAIQGQGDGRTQSTRAARRAPPRRRRSSLTEPTDRSISPTIRTKTILREMTPTGAESSSRLTRLPLERKTGFKLWKMIAMTMSPTTTGSAPRSPERMSRSAARSRPAGLESWEMRSSVVSSCPVLIVRLPCLLSRCS